MLLVAVLGGFCWGDSDFIAADSLSGPPDLLRFSVALASHHIQERMVHASLSEATSDLCPLCGLSPENVLHLTWRCPRTETLRARLRCSVAALSFLPKP